MEDLEINPETLTENPQIAAVEILQKALEVTTYALLTAHLPREHHDGLPCKDALGAFTAAILHQIRALEATLTGYGTELAYESRRQIPASLPPGAEIPW